MTCNHLLFFISSIHQHTYVNSPSILIRLPIVLSKSLHTHVGGKVAGQASIASIVQVTWCDLLVATPYYEIRIFFNNLDYDISGIVRNQMTFQF